MVLGMGIESSGWSVVHGYMLRWDHDYKPKRSCKRMMGTITFGKFLGAFEPFSFLFVDFFFSLLNLGLFFCTIF